MDSPWITRQARVDHRLPTLAGLSPTTPQDRQPIFSQDTCTTGSHEFDPDQPIGSKSPKSLLTSEASRPIIPSSRKRHPTSTSLVTRPISPSLSHWTAGPIADDLEGASRWLDAHPELLGAIGAATWETVDRRLLDAARDGGVETGDAVRIDSTVTETHILEPSNSRLLFEGVRVLTRLLREAQDELGAAAIDFHDHRRGAQRRALEAGSQRGAERRAKTYRKLLRLTGRTAGYIEAALPAVRAADTAWSRGWVEAATAYLELFGNVTDQTERRVFGGETVPAGEKVVSLFEPHTDIVVKGGRGTHYGHKINLATGRTGLVLDVVVEDGNPADSARPPAVGRCLPMLKRHIEHYGAAP